MKAVILFVFVLVLNSYFLTAVHITGHDVFAAGGSGEGELAVTGGQQDTGFTGIPEVVEVPSGTGGGGGSSTSELLQFDKGFFSVQVKKGENYQEKITVTNVGNIALTVDISTNLPEFVFPQQDTLVFEAGESKEVLFDIYVSDKESSDVYPGKIFFDFLNTQRFVNFVLDVESKEPLFDIKTTLLDKYVLPGSRIKADLFILNLGDLKNIDVELEYFIRDFNNNTYALKKESFAINDSAEKEVFLHVPRGLEGGDYLFFSKVSYKNISANSYDTFTLQKIAYFLWLGLIWINLFLIIIVGGSIIYLLNKKDEKQRKYYFDYG